MEWNKTVISQCSMWLKNSLERSGSRQPSRHAPHFLYWRQSADKYITGQSEKTLAHNDICNATLLGEVFLISWQGEKDRYGKQQLLRIIWPPKSKPIYFPQLNDTNTVVSDEEVLPQPGICVEFNPGAILGAHGERIHSQLHKIALPWERHDF